MLLLKFAQSSFVGSRSFLGNAFQFIGVLGLDSLQFLGVFLNGNSQLGSCIRRLVLQSLQLVILLLKLGVLLDVLGFGLALEVLYAVL